MGDPILHVVFEAAVEVSNGKAKGVTYKGCGLSLDPAAGMCIAVGGQGKMATFPANTVKKVHTKFLHDGKLTLEVVAGKQGHKMVLVSKATPEDLTLMLRTVDETMQVAKLRQSVRPTQEECIAVLQNRWPQQVKKQLAKLAKDTGNAAPQPVKGHTRLMLVVDAAGQGGAAVSVMQAGKALCKLAESELKLTSHARPGECNVQTFKAVCKDSADKSVQLEIRARTATYHRWPNALWLDFDIGEKVAVAAFRAAVVKAFAQGDEAQCLITQLAHGFIKERLAANLVLHLRSGVTSTNADGSGGDFGTRLELRWGELDLQSAPLGRCEVRFWEDSTRMAAPVVTAFEMQPEPCKAWGVAHGDKPASVLAASLIARLEVFCLRLAASASGAGTRTRVLVLGWLPQVKMTGAFQKRQFVFQGDPDKSLGFKMLRSGEAMKRDASAAGAAAAAGAGSPAAIAGPSGAAGAASSASAFAGKANPAGESTPGLATLPSAAGKRRRPEDGESLGSATAGGVDSLASGGSGSSEPAVVKKEVKEEVNEEEEAVVKPEAIELGEIGDLGRAPAKAAKAEEEEKEYVPVSISASLSASLGVDGAFDPAKLAAGAATSGEGGAAAGGGEEMDEMDATMAELLGEA